MEMALLTTQGKAGLAGAMVAVSAYLRAAPETLQALHRIANTQASAAMGSAVQSAAAYYRHLDDLLPDRFGVYGRLDDSWLVHHLASHVVAAGLATVDELPSGWLEAVAAARNARHTTVGTALGSLQLPARLPFSRTSWSFDTAVPLLSDRYP